MIGVFFSRKAVELIALVDRKENANAQWFKNSCIQPLIDKWQNRNVKHSVSNLVIHFDNARPHTSDIVTSYIAEKEGVTRLEHPPYSPDLSPCDFWLFPTIKNRMKGKVYYTDTEVLEAFKENADLLETKDFKNAFSTWIKRCKTVLSKNGDYY